MAISRRKFLALGGGLIASATMAEAGALAEYMDWMKRKPAFSFAPYRPYDGPEVFVVTRVVRGIPVAFNGPFLPVDMTVPEGLSRIPWEKDWGYAASAIHTKHVGKRKRPLPGFVREGDIIDYYDMRTMPPPTESAQRNDEVVRRGILSAYEAEQSGDRGRIAASMDWRHGFGFGSELG